jgi:Ca-activated chloride channel family protein
MALEAPDVMWKSRIGRILLGPVLLSVGILAQEPTPRFAAGVQLVEVYATVTDARGELVKNLTQADFSISEDGQPQEISAFIRGDFPLSVALGVDRSWSMAGEPLRLAKQASQAFLRELRPGDRSMVLAISNQADVIAPMGEDRAAQARAIAALDPWSTTALQDAVIVALDRLEGEPGRQALIVFSDGTDRYSQARPADVLDRARRSNALVYPIALGKTRPPLLAELAVLTGGRSFLLKDARDLQPALAAIARELRSQYLIGYVPLRTPLQDSRQWRSIMVSLKNQPAGTRVRARDGYITE